MHHVLECISLYFYFGYHLYRITWKSIIPRTISVTSTILILAFIHVSFTMVINFTLQFSPSLQWLCVYICLLAVCFCFVFLFVCVYGVSGRLSSPVVSSVLASLEAKVWVHKRSTVHLFAYLHKIFITEQNVECVWVCTLSVTRHRVEEAHTNTHTLPSEQESRVRNQALSL